MVDHLQRHIVGIAYPKCVIWRMSPGGASCIVRSSKRTVTQKHLLLPKSANIPLTRVQHFFSSLVRRALSIAVGGDG